MLRKSESRMRSLIAQFSTSCIKWQAEYDRKCPHIVRQVLLHSEETGKMLGKLTTSNTNCLSSPCTREYENDRYFDVHREIEKLD